MFRFATHALAVLGMLFVTGTAMADGASRYGKQYVVYHINYNGGKEDKAYRAAMRNIQNHINAVGKDNIDVRVVLHGNGVSLLKNAMKNQKLQSDITSLKTQSVNFAVCKNTLKGRKINYKKDLFEVFDEDIVPSGVAELAHLQRLGYVYIKP
jgi:intracellular sulfur oxidation DsrE/DsrF family protein